MSGSVFVTVGRVGFNLLLVGWLDGCTRGCARGLGVLVARLLVGLAGLKRLDVVFGFAVVD